MNLPLSGWIVTEHQEQPRLYLARAMRNGERVGAVIVYCTLTGLRKRLPYGLQRTSAPETHRDIIEIWQ